MEETDYNPARRLHDVISQGPRPGDSESAWKVFSRVLKVSEEDPALLMERIAQVAALTNEVKLAIDAVPNINSDLFLGWHPKAAATIRTFNPHQNWRTFVAGFPPESMTAINFCADLLSRHQPERRIPNESIADLLSGVNDLLDDLNATELRSPDWMFVRHHLLKVKEVLEAYEIGGIGPIEDAYAQSIGAMLLSPDVSRSLGETDRGKRFFRIIGSIATVLSIYGGISALTQDATRMLNAIGLLGDR